MIALMMVVYVGPQVRAELHVEVDYDIAFHNAHRISNEVRDVVEALDEVDLPYFHLEPVQHHLGKLP